MTRSSATSCAAAVALLTVACGAPTPSPVPTKKHVARLEARPARSVPLGHVDTAVVRLDKDIEAKLIPYPMWVSIASIDDVILVEAPPAGPPVVPEPLRPAVGGDALRIADRALERGDAVDAIAQYRALLPRAPASSTPYIELQLARAYVALQQTDAAVLHLNNILAVERGDSRVHWPAVAELASVRIRSRGDSALETLQALAPYVAAYEPDLGLHVLHLAEPHERNDVRAWLSAHDPDPFVSCAYDLAVLELGPSNLPAWGWCPQRARTDAIVRHALIPLRRLSMVAIKWDGDRTTAADWIALAIDAGLLVDESTGPTAQVTSWVALAACYNAAVIGAATSTKLEGHVDRREEIVSNLVLAHQPLARRLLSTVLVDDPP